VRARAQRATVSPVTNPSDATFCEPVEKANSNQSLTAGLATGLGISSAPLRAYSMAKYGMLAKGDAEIFMKFARGDYKEKVGEQFFICRGQVYFSCSHYSACPSSCMQLLRSQSAAIRHVGFRL
jgi:hypothetical protein